jgi:serine protease Do
MLEEFYGQRGGIPQMQRPQQALGTGFVIKEDGLIITNNHVISGADKISVQFNDADEKQYEAKVIGSDDRTDIALIKIEGKGFPTVKFGSSKNTEVGEWVAAFGNPYGNGHTMTSGIISAKGRDISEINRFPLLQTDAPINPGNSGGPLVNLKGEVIGVNSAIDARAQGIGFAIPIDEVKSILPQLEKSISIKKGYIGVVLGYVSPQSQSALGMENIEGAFIMQVEPGGPADKAGIKPYDVITEFNGRKIREPGELTFAVSDTTVGATAKAKLMRDGKPMTVDVKVAERNEGRIKKAMETGKRNFGSEAPFNLGFQVADVNEALVKEFELPTDVKRPVIVQVQESSPARGAGLLPGDMILDVNRKETTRADQVLKQLKKGVNTLRIFREGTVILILLKAG